MRNVRAGCVGALVAVISPGCRRKAWSRVAGSGVAGRRLEVIMTLFHRRGRPRAARATAATLTMGLVAVALLFSSSARAQTSPACSDDVIGM